jgi:hypothetical protein
VPPGGRHPLYLRRKSATATGCRVGNSTFSEDTAKFWNPTVERIVNALPPAEAEAARTGREPAAFYDALSQVGAPS